MYNMNLGEKTDIKTGKATHSGKSAHSGTAAQSGTAMHSDSGTHSRTADEPLESYIPGVGRNNRSADLGTTGGTGEAYPPAGAQHSHKEGKPLESYIPGVGRRNHPLDSELVEEGKMGHTSGATHHHDTSLAKSGDQHYAAGIPESTSKAYSSEPHIPGTGRINEPPQHIKKSNFDPNELVGAKMGSQNIKQGSQNTAIPGFESKERTHIPGTGVSGQAYPLKNDAIDRGNVPRPAHISDSATTGVNAPARGDSRKISEFNEPSQTAHHGSHQQSDPVLDFPAHAYTTPKTNPETRTEKSSGHQVPGANVATAPPAAYGGSTQRKDASTSSGSKTFGKSGHDQETGKNATHSESPSHSGPKLFGKDIGFHKSHSHDQPKDATGEEHSSHSGTKIFGKELNFGKNQHEPAHDSNAHTSSNPTSAKGAIGTTGREYGSERNRTDITTSTGDRKANKGLNEDKSNVFPSKRPTTEDQPIVGNTSGNPSNSGAKKTDRSLSIGSEEAGSYAKNVVNMPSLVDPSVPTYRHKEETTATMGEGGTYKIHSENMTERKVSVGSHEHEPHGESHGPSHAGQGHGHPEPILEQTIETQEFRNYGPESVPRFHEEKDKDALQEHKSASQEEHAKPGVIETIKNAITHHNNE